MGNITTINLKEEEDIAIKNISSGSYQLIMKSLEFTISKLKAAKSDEQITALLEEYTTLHKKLKKEYPVKLPLTRLDVIDF